MKSSLKSVLVATLLIAFLAPSGLLLISIYQNQTQSPNISSTPKSVRDFFDLSPAERVKMLERDPQIFKRYSDNELLEATEKFHGPGKLDVYRELSHRCKTSANLNSLITERCMESNDESEVLSLHSLLSAQIPSYKKVTHRIIRVHKNRLSVSSMGTLFSRLLYTFGEQYIAEYVRSGQASVKEKEAIKLALAPPPFADE